jgi:histidyl-tRNA synthetase
LFHFSGSTADRLNQMKLFLKNSEVGLKGIEELEYVFDQTNILGLERATIEFDVTLARGLNYYTGAIFEVKVHDVEIGSICGGGRYDDLTGLFGLKNMPGVGISFGADRIYLVLEALNLFPENTKNNLTLMFANFGQKEATYCQTLAQKIRKLGISAEVYPDNVKMQKQFKYANLRPVKFVAIVGEEELKNKTIQLKNMETGHQFSCSEEELINYFLVNPKPKVKI